MAEVELRSLRVSAQMDASQYSAGAAQKIAADKAMIASGQTTAAAVTQTEAKISQAGDVLARLSRQYVDGYASAQRFNSALNQLSNGLERGKISAEQTGPILDGIFRKYGLMGDAAQFAARGQTELAAAITRANAKLAEQRNLTPTNQNLGANRFGSLNATSQFQDIAITSAMGQSPLTIALQQGTQLGMALEQQLGDQGAKGLVKGLGSAFMGLLTPINLIAIGLTGAVAVAIQFGSKLLPQVKSLKDATEDQRKAVTDLAEAYGMASLKADDFYKKSLIASESEARRNNDALQKASDLANTAALRQLTTFVTPGRSAGGYFGVTQADFRPFNDAIQELNKEVRAGHPDYVAFEKSISDVVANNPGLQTTADKILGIVAAATAAAAQLTNTANVIKDLNRSSVGNFDRTQQAGRDQSIMSQRFGDDPFAAAREEQRKKEIALTEAQDERKRSLDRTLESAKLDIDLIGKTTAQVEGLRMAAQLEAQVREEAAKNNVAVDQAEIALIRQKSAEYGKMVALQQARDTIHGQEQDLEVMRAELGLVGASALEHDRVIAALKNEQYIREKGIPLYGQEAESLRKNTALQADYNEQLAKSKIQQDLLFEIRQAGRSEQDQSIASQLRSAGLPEDLDSDIAKVIKMRDEIARMKDTWNEVFQTARDGIDGVVDALFDGGDIGEALKKAGRDFARQMFDLAATNPLKNWLTGSNLNTIADMGIFGNGATSGRGGGFGGVLGNVLGAQKAVASMQVQAASVFINGAPIGGLGGGLGSLLGGQSGTPFQANTTLTDFLTGGGGSGAANQNFIQNRIDQAFGTNGVAQNLIQSRIDQAFGTSSGGLGGIFSPDGGFASSTGGAASIMSLGGSGGTVTDMIRRAAAAEGIDPDIFLKVAKSEGGLSGFVQSSVFKNGIQEPSFGPMQLLRGGPGTGFPKGLGNAFEEQTGLSVSDPANMEAGINFAAKQAKQSGWSQWYGAKAAGVSRWEGINQGSPGIDPMTTESISNLGDTAKAAASGISTVNSAGMQVSQSLVNAAGGLNNFGSMLSSFMSSASGGGSSWFQNLAGMFGGSGGALNFMSGISPKATTDILSGSWGLFAEGTESAPPGWAWVGEKGPELKKLRAGDVIRSNPRSIEMMKQASAGSNDNMEATLRKLAPLFRSNVKNINVFDPSVVGDYLSTNQGEEIIMNVLRRNGK